MPKINIIEDEQTRSAALDITENVVFIPVFTKSNPTVIGKLNFYETAKAFIKDFGGDHIFKLNDANDRSFVMAAQCLNLGLKVLAYGVDAPNIESLPTVSVNQQVTNFVPGTTKLNSTPKGTVSLYYNGSEVTSFNKFTPVSSDISLSGASSYTVSLTVQQGATYIENTLQFNDGVLQPKSATVSISGTTATVTASFESAVTLISVGIDTNVPTGITSVTYDSSTLVVNIAPEFDTEHDTISVDELRYEHEQTKDDVATDAMQKALSTAMDLIKSKNLYNVKFITGGGYACIDSGLENAAAERKDCLALLDPAIGVTIDDAITNNIADGKDQFAAIFMPWCAFNLPVDITGLESTAEYVLPGSAAYLFAYARSVQSNANWFAASGISRGAIPNLKQPLQEVTEAQMHQLQGDDGSKLSYINPIMQVGSYGYRIWGNRVCSTTNGENSYFKFLNVRMLLCDIHKTLYSAALRSTFEPNDDVTWINFKTMCSGTLDRMTSGRGLNWYRWRREKVTDKATIKAILTISPIEAVENFDLTIFLTDQDVEVVE